MIEMTTYGPWIALAATMVYVLITANEFIKENNHDERD